MDTTTVDTTTVGPSDAPASEGRDLQVQAQVTNGGPVLELAGPLRAENVVPARDALLGAARDPAMWPLVIDLRRVEEVDADGLGLLQEVRIGYAEATRPDSIASNWPLSLLLTPGSQPDRVLRLGHLDDVMNLIYLS